MQDALPALVLNSEALPRTAMNDTPPTAACPASPASDEHLMLAFSKGSAEPFNELFLRYKQPIYGFFRRRTALRNLLEPTAAPAPSDAAQLAEPTAPPTGAQSIPQKGFRL